MFLANYFQTYKEEIELIRTQNRVECDLYSIIAHIVRASKQGANISLRDVSTRRGTNFSKPFMGDAGFPDFVIRERAKNKDAKILGAIEVKYVDVDLEKHLKQLQGHCNFYKQVLYTNGLEWRFYNELGTKMTWSVILGKVDKDEISWNDDTKWQCLLEKLDKIHWIQ